MPVEFLTDEQASAYGRFVGTPSHAALERFFFLDDADKALVEKRRGEANRLGFGLQLGTVRSLGTFLADPVDVPTAAIDYVAGQLDVHDPSRLKAYAKREKTPARAPVGDRPGLRLPGLRGGGDRAVDLGRRPGLDDR